MTQKSIQKILEIGVMLSSEREPTKLMDKILSAVMDAANCDAGTLYILNRPESSGDTESTPDSRKLPENSENAKGMPGSGNTEGTPGSPSRSKKSADTKDTPGSLEFRIMRNNTMGTYVGADGKSPDLPPVPLSRTNVCAYAFLEGRTVNIEDVYECEEYDFTGPRNYDRITGYRTRSMLAVPMRDRNGEGIGVLQLINAMDEHGNVCSFSEEMALVLESAASQAAVAIQNVRYLRDIRALLDSVVHMMSSAIDERTPYNASHTRHMAECGDGFIDYLNDIAVRETGEIRFTDAQKDEILMSVWLHDVGKLVTPLEVMNKAARLLPEQHSEFLHRMEKIRLLGRVGLAEGRITAEQYADLEEQVSEAANLVETSNTAGFLPDEKLARIAKLASHTYQELDGSVRPWLAPDECAMLSIRKGTLSEDERGVMEEHVRVTDRLLSEIHFSPEFSHVRKWAASHHEFLNGSGYPAHLKADEIPCEVRIITILDIFDALVADDRPYKPGMPVEKAISIITSMAEKEGKLDPVLTGQFIESRCWEKAGYGFLNNAGGNGNV